MIRLSIIAAVVAIAASAPASAEQRRFPMTGYDRVAVAGSDDVVITRGAFSVVGDGDEAELDRLEIKVEDGVLKIGRKSGNWGWNNKDVKLSVALPALHGLTVSGSSEVTAERGEGERFALKISGSGAVNMRLLDVKTADITLSGSGNLVAAGRCGALNLVMSGSGDANLAQLKCTNAAIRVSGSADVAAFATGQASVRVSGSGDVVLTGGARCTKAVSGSGEVQCS